MRIREILSEQGSMIAPSSGTSSSSVKPTIGTVGSSTNPPTAQPASTNTATNATNAAASSPAQKAFNTLLAQNKIDPEFTNAYAAQSQNPNAELNAEQQAAMTQFAAATLKNPQLATQMATSMKQLGPTTVPPKQ